MLALAAIYLALAPADHLLVVSHVPSAFVACQRPLDMPVLPAPAPDGLVTKRAGLIPQKGRMVVCHPVNTPPPVLLRHKRSYWAATVGISRCGYAVPEVV